MNSSIISFFHIFLVGVYTGNCQFLKIKVPSKVNIKDSKSCEKSNHVNSRKAIVSLVTFKSLSEIDSN